MLEGADPTQEDSAHVSTEEVRPAVSGAGGPDGDGAPITAPHSVLNAWVQALTALARVTHRVRITSTFRTWSSGLRSRSGSGRLGRSVRRRGGRTCRPCAGPAGWASSPLRPARRPWSVPSQGGTERAGAFHSD